MPNLPPEVVRVVAEVRARQWDRLYGPLIGPRTRFEHEAREILEALDGICQMPAVRLPEAEDEEP